MEVSAEELPIVMNTYTTDDSVVMYVRNHEIDRIFIGNQECSDFKVSESNGVRTFILLDNSYSINKNYREDIKSFLKDLIGARGEGDRFTIAVFSDHLDYIVQDSSDYLSMKESIDAIEFNEHDSYFSACLAEAVDELQKDDSNTYTRIIGISDGAETEALGYTKEELDKKFSEAHYPIYTIGCFTKNNEENLKNMFAISRLSNGKDFLLDDTPVNDVLQYLINDSDVIRVEFKPPVELCDGTVKPVRIIMGEDFSTADLQMPFIASSQETATPEPEATAAPEPETEKKRFFISRKVLIGIIGALGLSALVTLILILTKNKKPKEPEQPPVDLSMIGHSKNTVMIKDQKEPKTQILNYAKAGQTPQSAPETSKPVYLCLQDINDPTKSFQYPIRGSVKIGKDAGRCQILINYSQFISSVHCEIVSGNGFFFVKDGVNGQPSTNGTFVNNQKVAGSAPLKEGDILRLAEVSFKVSFQ